MPWRTALGDGDVMHAGDVSLQALHTPGHSPDHLAFWHEDSGTIFTGDLVVKGSSVMIHWSRGGDLGLYLASLERLLSLEPWRLLPAHGPAIDDPRTVLTGYLRSTASRRERQGCSMRSAPATPACRRLPNPSMMVSRACADAGGAGKTCARTSKN